VYASLRLRETPGLEDDPMCAGAGFMMETTFEPRRGRRADSALAAFYVAAFGIALSTEEMREALPTAVEVDDLESALARVWDHGGTILSTPDDRCAGVTPAIATIRDPRGNLVSLYATARRAIA
jgi:predicted enzyme related to lactoylglutathione lyase